VTRDYLPWGEGAAGGRSESNKESDKTIKEGEKPRRFQGEGPREEYSAITNA